MKPAANAIDMPKATVSTTAKRPITTGRLDAYAFIFSIFVINLLMPITRRMKRVGMRV